MKTKTTLNKNQVVTVFVTLSFIGAVLPAMTQAAEKSIAQSLDVSVFPSGGQTPEQQSKDEGTCYNWAVSDSGVDPFALEKQQSAEAGQSAQAQQEIAEAGGGSGVRGAAGGAAAGALVGDIADTDAGKDAEIGALVGGLAARRRERREKEEASEEVGAVQQQSKQLSAEDKSHFDKSFSTCLEAKKYMVEY